MGTMRFGVAAWLLALTATAGAEAIPVATGTAMACPTATIGSRAIPTATDALRDARGRCPISICCDALASTRA